jgi:hypothetical protein
MLLAEYLSIAEHTLAQFCRRYPVHRLAFLGSPLCQGWTMGIRWLGRC